MIDLASTGLRLRLDPSVGAGIVSLVHLASERELLFQAPWEVKADSGRGRGNQAWAQGWPGGWNFLFPNAGEPCEVDGEHHGYHGDASVEPWETLERSASHSRLGWADQGLAVEREVDVTSHTVSARTVVRNESSEPRAFLAVEHVIFGGLLSSPGASVHVTGPETTLLVPGSPGAWFYALSCERDGPTILTAPEGKAQVSVTSKGFPALWLWSEQSSATTPPWSGRTSCVGIEPATSRCCEGLSAAVAEGSASMLAAGEWMSFSLCLSVSFV